MEQKKQRNASYIKGWETLSHFVSMFCAATFNHVMASFCIGLIGGSLWFYVPLSQAQKDHLHRYFQQILPFRFVPEAAQLQSQLYDGRSWDFLLKQWIFDVVIVCLFAAVLLSVVVYLISQALMKKRVVRGAVLQRQKPNQWIWRSVGWGSFAGFLCYLLMWSSDQRHLFWDYFWASTYLTFDSIANFASPDGQGQIAWFGGDFLQIQPYRDQLRLEVFRDRSLLYFVFRYMFYWFGSFCVLSGFFFYFDKRMGTPSFLSGLRIFRWFGFAGGDKKKGAQKNFSLANQKIPAGHETQHILCLGSPGSGKSTIIKELLDQIRERHQRAVVFDPSGEFIEAYFREDRDIILNPLDDRMPQWNPWLEIRNIEDYLTFGGSLFPSEGKDPFWASAGATIFSSLLERMNDFKVRSNVQLYKKINETPLEELSSYLAGTQAEKFLDPKAGAMPLNVMATVMSKTKAWRFLPDKLNSDPFSIRDFVENEDSDSWLFLSMRADQEAVLRPLVSLWTDLVANSILSLKPDSQRRFWTVLDELSTLQRLSILEPLLAKARKYGAPVVLGLQSISQLRSIYGRDQASALVSQPQTWLVLRSVEPETSEWLERALGKFDADEIRQSISMGANSQRDGVSLQEQRRTESVATATEIAGLPSLEGYLRISGQQNVNYVKFAWKERDRIAQDFVPVGSAEKMSA